MSNLGAPIARADGPIKVTGAARYAGDQNQPGQLYAVFVTATVPAGRVAAIDPRAAAAMRGVNRVLTAADMPRVLANLAKITAPPLATRFIPMQSDIVVHEGQPVAMVLAESLEAAEAGAAAVRVVYERATFMVPEHTAAQAADTTKGAYPGYGMLDFKKGDPDAAFAAAPVKAGGEYLQPSRHANPMEPSATVAVWNGDALTVYDAVQHLPAVQTVLAATFGIPATQVRVISPHTGGGFGAKGFVWPHELLTAMAAKVVRRPVKLVLSRQQMYGMVGAQPQTSQIVRLGADARGKLLSISHQAINVTGLTEDYVEFSTLPSRSFFACDNIVSSHRVRRGQHDPADVHAVAVGRPWLLGARLGDGRTRAVAQDRSARSTADQLCADRSAKRQTLVVQEAARGLSGRRSPVWLAEPAERRHARRSLADRLRHGR